MSGSHFSSKCRNKAHQCLAALDLYVDNPNMAAQNFGLNIFDMGVSGTYYGFNVYLLWLEQLEWIVLFLNLLCLLQALVRTCIKRKDCGKEIINIQVNQNTKGVYFPPYTGLVNFEFFAFGVNALAAIMLPSISTLTLAMRLIFKGVVTLTILITYFDGIISNFQNMYQAHPRIVQWT